jgi:cysteine synthase A
MPFAVEKIRTMEAFGADVELLSSPEGITPQLIPRMMARAAEIVEEVDGFATDQFRNTDMIEGYRALGREILEQLDGPPDAFCAYIGTAGCFLGVTREIKASVPTLHRVAVEPAESPALSEGRSGTHHIEGGGIGFRPPMLAQEDVDEVIAVPEAQAFAMARRAAQEEGLISGPSTGANIAAALALARRLGSGRRVVTIQVDSGLKYLASDLYAG